MIEFIKGIADDLNPKLSCICEKCLEELRRRIEEFIKENSRGGDDEQM